MSKSKAVALDLVSPGERPTSDQKHLLERMLAACGDKVMYLIERPILNAGTRMEWMIVVGMLINLLTLRQVFQDRLHPSESGSLGEFIARGTFIILRRFPKGSTKAVSSMS